MNTVIVLNILLGTILLIIALNNEIKFKIIQYLESYSQETGYPLYQTKANKEINQLLSRIFLSGLILFTLGLVGLVYKIIG